MTALQLVGYTSTQSGCVCPTGYARVDRFNGDENLFSFIVNVWWSEEAFTANLSPIDNRHYSIPTSVVTGTAPLYAYLSSLPEFAGSTIVS